MRNFLSDSFAAASSVGGGLVMRLSDVLRTGTLRCFSTFAAADEAMGFDGFNVAAGACANVGSPWRLSSAPTVRVPAVPGWGISMVSSQEGQSIFEPAPALSTSSSCSQLGQLKMMSIDKWYNRNARLKRP